VEDAQRRGKTTQSKDAEQGEPMTKSKGIAAAGATDPILAKTQELGQSIWLDNMGRGLLRSGGLAKPVKQGVTGCTSNPTIVEKAIGVSHDYDTEPERLV